MSNTHSLLQLRFSPSLSGGDASAGDIPTRFTGICYSGGVVPNYGHLGDVAIDLSTLKAPTKALFVLINHDYDQRAGTCGIDSDGQTIAINGTFLKNSSGRQVAEEFADGAPWEFSVGINAAHDVFESPTEIVLNGRTMTVDTVLRNAAIREVSFVPAGADPHTRAVAFTQETRVSEPNLLELSRSLDAEKAAKLELESRVTCLTDDLNSLKAQVATANDLKQQAEIDRDAAIAKLDVAEKRATALEAELTALRHTVRETAVSALFAELGREVTEKSVEPYLTLSDDVFALLANDLRATKANKIDPTLFQDRATAGRDSSPESTVISLATEVRKNQPALTQEQAIARVLANNPTLYADHRNLGAL